MLGVFVVLGSGCGGGRSAPSRPVDNQTAKLSAEECLALLAGAVGVEAGTPLGVERRLPSDSDDGSHQTELVQAESITLRGDPDATICIASVRRDQVPCDECPPEDQSTDATHVVAVVAGGRVTDQQTIASSMADLVSTGFPSWSVEAIGPAADALVITEHDESGDTSLHRVAWWTVTGGALVEQFSYRSGIEGGLEVADVAYEIGTEATNGHFPIVFTVKELVDEFSDPPTSSAERRTCSWDAATAKYECDVEELAP